MANSSHNLCTSKTTLTLFCRCSIVHYLTHEATAVCLKEKVAEGHDWQLPMTAVAGTD